MISLACSLRQHQLCVDKEATREEDAGCYCECHLPRRIRQALEHADETLAASDRFVEENDE